MLYTQLYIIHFLEGYNNPESNSPERIIAENINPERICPAFKNLRPSGISERTLPEKIIKNHEINKNWKLNHE